MLEFVLIAPVLSYLIVGILFFRHHIDYAQDSASRFNQRTFRHIVPDQARGASGAASDENGFGAFVDIRQAVQLSGLMGTGASTGFALAAERFFNGGTGTPYDRMQLRRGNYLTNYEPIAAMPDDPWANILGGLGTYVGDRIGGGAYDKPEGLENGWKERFPLTTDPWQRHFYNDLDARNYLVVGLIFELLNPLTFGRSGPNERFDNRDTDIGASEFVDDGGTCDELRLEQVSGNQVWDIVK
jgi:hypothetical protein